jgi:hypothetical protein
VFSEFSYLAEELKQSRETISENQKTNIGESIKKNPEKFLKSKAFQRLKDDH